ncbi:MAG TPA: DUF2007 domain-containing protein [Syntrophorhabdales bacterium]|nr:DUF2007 domain-containing protein [Syntrophorhabdales bacterium]
MFCPKCRTEYVEGISVCADCGVPLIAQLNEDDKSSEWVELEEILATFNAGDIALIKSILDGEGITYSFFGEEFNYVQPLIQPAKLMVPKDQAERAREVLKDLNLEHALTKDVHEYTEDSEEQ